MKRIVPILLLGVSFMVMGCPSDGVDDVNEPPELRSMTQAHTIQAGSDVTETISATDPEHDAMTFRIIDNPGFVSIRDTSQLVGTASATLVIAPDIGQEGTYQFEVRVEDSRGGYDGESCAVEVTPPPVDLVLVTPSNATVTEGETVTLYAVPRDAHGNALDRAVSWSSSDPSVATAATNWASSSEALRVSASSGPVINTLISRPNGG